MPERTLPNASMVVLVVFAGAFLVVLSVHPEPFGGWALWALTPLLVYFAYVLAFRTTPQSARLFVASWAAVGYAAVYGIVAGLGDESYTDVARIVYLVLPALGLLLMIGCVAVIELVSAFAAMRSPMGLPQRHASPSGRAGLAGAALVAGWVTVAVAGWAGPSVVVVESGGGPASVARVRCEDGDTYLLTPTVVRQPNGIHISVDNRSHEDIWLEYEMDGGANGGGAELLARGVSERLISMRGGSIGVACSHRGDGSASAHATMAVVRAH